LLSAVIRERFELRGKQEVVLRDFDELRNAARPLEGGALEAVDRVLKHVADNAEFVGSAVALFPHRDYPIAYAKHHDEFSNLIMGIGVPLGYLSAHGVDPISVSVTPGGWARLQSIRTKAVERNQAFVAMWFDRTLVPAYTVGILPALEKWGYRALRIDREEHNEKIDDRIIAAIRRSAVVIADVTGQRTGVYYEAGFAQGLGIPVIWCCRSEEIDKLHFDTRQYNHIIWSTPEDLRRKLEDRIEATLPHLTNATFETS
jgi:nucleoside 2-deoxyribosyltransferase